MANTRWVPAIIAAGVIVAGASIGTAWAGGPSGTVEPDISAAVGSGAFAGELVGFVATGATNDEASARVIAACQAAGGVDCTADEVTNDNLCIVSVVDDETDVVAGGAGPTIEAAQADALARAAAAGTPEGVGATILVSSCP